MPVGTTLVARLASVLKKKKAGLNRADGALSGMADSELTRLSASSRQAEGDNKQYSEDSQAVLRNQR